MSTTFSAGAAILAPCRGGVGFLRVMIYSRGVQDQEMEWTPALDS